MTRYAIAISSLLAALVFLWACASMPNPRKVINDFIDLALPADFKGDAHIHNKNPYAEIDLWAGGLERKPEGWTWTWLVYKSSYPIGGTTIHFGKPPENLFP